MHRALGLTLLLFGSSCLSFAQDPCAPGDLTGAAKTVAAIRRSLSSVAVPRDDAAVPAAVAAQLDQLKTALAAAADAAFGCAPLRATAEQRQTTLAEALDANRSSESETATAIKDGQDLGAYGSGLAVGVVQLADKPELFEVDFRYGVECGDDNLVLVYEHFGRSAFPGLHQRLRWSAPSYRTVDDALGDFLLLTPLTGSPDPPTWRFVVAHGHPGCARTPRPSRFDLDLLRPTDDPAHPAVDWHFDHPYTQDPGVVPRLTTTEDTVELRLTPAPPSPAKASKPPAPPASPGPEIYRFHLNAHGGIEPSALALLVVLTPHWPP